MRRVKVEAAVVFPAEAAIVFAMMTDEGYVNRKATAMGALEHDASVTLLPSGGAQIRLQRTMPAMVPDFVRPLVGDTIEVEHVEDWEPARPDGSRVGLLTAKIPSAPVNLSGRLVLETNGSAGSIHRVDIDIKARVPFVGGKIEKAIGEVLLMAARKEEQVGGQWLAEHA